MSRAFPGFPELTKYEPKCKVCQLALTHAGLLKLVHRYRHDEDLGDYALHTRIRPIFERHAVSMPSQRSIGRHMDGHIDIKLITELNEFDMPDPVEVQLERLADAEGALQQTNPLDFALGRNDSDYHSMGDLFRRLMRRIAALDADPEAFVNPNGTHSLQKLSVWASMINNAKSIIEGLNKMRNSDRMTVSILEQHTKRYATAIVGPLGEAVRSVRDELTEIDHPKARELATRMTLLLEQDVSHIFTEAAIKSLRVTREKYKLLN